MTDRPGSSDYDLHAQRDDVTATSRKSTSGTERKKPSKRTRQTIMEGVDVELEGGINWKEIRQSSSSELGQMWISICSFLMNLPDHISSLWTRIQQLCYGWIYILYGKWFERMLADLHLARRYNLDVVWLRLVKFTPDVRKYCLSKAQLSSKIVPTALLDLIELVRQRENPDMVPLTALIDEIETKRTGELWNMLCIIREQRLEVEGKLSSFLTAIKPWSFEIMLTVVDSQTINVTNMLRRIEQTGVHLYS
jgi:hypothetical protein